jgi:hypothetical protein
MAHPGTLYKIQFLLSYAFKYYVWQLLAEYEKEPHKPQLKKEGSLMQLDLHKINGD